MPKDVCKAIFTQIAFYGWTLEDQEEVEDIIEEVVEKCHGSPLAAKVLGGILQSKKARKEWTRLLKSELWQLEEARQDVFGPLALSYYDLPPAIRQCFQFCSVFPKDFEIEKDELIKLWMSQGFLRATRNQDIEGIGEHYFQILGMRSFFQDFEKRDVWVGEKTYCKMHDLVHDFARLISGNESICMTNREVENHAPSTNHLRSFIASSVDASKPDVFDHLRGIRLLVLKDVHLKAVSSTINQLIHLRHLDLSYNDILIELPEEICELYNLETLLLNLNTRLKKLPSGMGNKLVNLKHLENDEVPACLPKQIGRLAASLKTLTQFNIVHEDERGSTNVWALEGMNQLQGSLYVKGLNKVTDCGEVKRAQFARKESLAHLWLDFASSMTEQVAASHREERVLEAVRPSSTSLERLDVIYYSGVTINPSWLLSLSNLTSLSFIGCLRVERLPPLGALPSLQQLNLTRMFEVNKVGAEFLGTSDINNNVAFPKLRLLHFEHLRNWEEWELAEEMSLTTVIMPRLRCLEVFHCRKLQKLPDLLLQK
ncbi:unnamed protein product [Linum trigynum]|uniref:NB-ARC domain-containing protein n=1 Tax=Linum trigynum TaxID=586398 RepID=A0AAV2CDE9_9ROSI